MLIILLLSFAAFGTLILITGPRLGRAAWVVGALAPLATLVWLGIHAGSIGAQIALTQQVSWVTSLGLIFDLRVDAFAALMILLVAGIGVLIFAYSWSYFGASPQIRKVAGFLTLFAGSMFGIVIADNLLVLFVFWELTSITSYLLIGVKDEDPEARAAAQQALLITGFGGLAMLGGFVILGQSAGTYQISELLANPPSGSSISLALVLILIGAFTKSAQYPFHSWLPGAMVAPTPISAYLHSSAMVLAGVYLVGRLAPTFAPVGVWRPLVVGVCLVTVLAGALRALRPFDLKQLLAFGTISQLGFMMLLLGIGHPAATAAGCALLLAHGIYKAALFMVVGVVDHETHTRDIRTIPILGTGWGLTKSVALVSAASMAAIPPMAGFIAKEKAYEALFKGSGGDRLILAAVVVGSIFTVVYSLRFAAALVRPGLVAERTTEATATHAPPVGFVLPATLLAAGTVTLGVIPALWSGLVDGAARALDPQASAKLALWHGLTIPLLLSLVTLAGGALLFWQRRPLASVQSRLAPPVNGTQVFDAVVRGTLHLAARVTSIVQSGSLRIYTTVILATAVLAPITAMMLGQWWPGWPTAVGSPAQIAVAGVLIGGALAATLARRRFTAAVLLGTVGYGMALLIVIQGAPDLALTQFAIETLSVVVFLLVFRALPARFARPGPFIGQPVRLAVAAGVGVFVALMGIATSGWRTAPAISQQMSERALPDGDGANIVNVILVDIRGLDTLGEVTVLLTAAIGIAMLAGAGSALYRKSRSAEPEVTEGAS